MCTVQNLHALHIHTVSKSCIEQCLQVFVFMHVTRLAFIKFAHKKFDSSCITLIHSLVNLNDTQAVHEFLTKISVKLVSTMHTSVKLKSNVLYG